MNKKQFFTYAAITAASITALGAATTFSISAAEATSGAGQDSPFVQKLAEKLGIDASKVASAVTSTKDEMRAIKVAQEKASIAEAVAAGKLTQKQADILIALQDIKFTKIPNNTDKPQDLSSLSETERKTKLNEMQTKRQEQLITALKDKGLTVTVEELSAAQTAARSAGIKVGFGMHRGPGKGGRGEMMSFEGETSAETN